MKKTKLLSIYFIVLFLSLLGTLWFKYFWDIKSYLSIICAGVSIVLFNVKKSFFKTLNHKILVGIFAYSILRIYITIDENINGWLICFSEITIVSIFLLLRDEIKENFLDFFSKKLSFILSLSILWWVIFLIVKNLPHESLMYGDENGYFYDDYYLFLKIVDQYSIEVFPRFQSLFLEPGHLGLFLPFILFIYKYNFRDNKFLYSFIIAILLSFSLAAYMLVVIGYVLSKISNLKSVFNLSIISMLLISTLLVFANSEDNIFNRLILSRLEVKDGNIAGDNRTNEIFDRNYEEFLSSSVLITGVGSVEYTQYDWKKGAAGYKVFIFKYGIIGLMLLFFTYLSFYKTFNTTYFSIIFLILYIVNFYQREYAYWLIQIILFIGGLSCLNKNGK